MKNLLISKIFRLKTSKNYLKIIKLYHKIFGENFKEKIDPSGIYNNEIQRNEIINKIIREKNFVNYLEIGCDEDVLFSRVQIKNKIGVDPNKGGTHRMTSDFFFKNNLLKFDLIFIDGLHTYEQVIKDIYNSVNCLNEKGIILLHDCFPFSYLDQAVPRAQRKWNGDVWKAITEIRTKKNLDTYVGAFDNGIGLILKRDNRKILLKPANNFKAIEFREYYKNYFEFLNLVSLEKFLKIINDYN
tara:strand:- start:3874 stop:4602 length:729 start_codon:yes stop_codon:yes gene_type:complete